MCGHPTLTVYHRQAQSNGYLGAAVNSAVRISDLAIRHLLCLLMAALLVGGPNMAYSSTMLTKFQEQETVPVLPVEEELAHSAATFLHPAWYSSLFAMTEADEHPIMFDERSIALLHGEVDVPPPKA